MDKSMTNLNLALVESDASKPVTGRDGEFPFRIGDLAREFDVTLRTLRFYEDKNLLQPKRSGTTRLYSELDRARLELILTGKKAGFALSEIKQLLSHYDFDTREFRDPSAVRDMFTEQLETLHEQRVELDIAEQAVKGAIENLAK